MKVLFGCINDLDALSEAEESGANVFYDMQGVGYDFCIHVDSEGIKIEDCIGRVVPISHRDVKALFRAIRSIKNSSEILSQAQDIADMFNDNDPYLDDAY